MLTPVIASDYSPTYWIEHDGEGKYIRLVRMASLPPEFDDGEDLPITPHAEQFAQKLWVKKGLDDPQRWARWRAKGILPVSG